jgi:molybdopterin-guanine dinucleotide biosynthesis protein A
LSAVHPGTTGILLLGGPSTRFGGSPKALATIGKETLAERAWRTLIEACDEVLVVGKERDRLELPFPLLDDGVEKRAPVFGLLAGLRAASHDVCLALPVDCPLVTPELLRSLADAVAVPQTGPLPGAYERASLPELEARVASGELSLRGVNPRVLDVDEAQLLNVNTRVDLVTARIAHWAGSREDVKAAVVVGSQARSDAPADRWSDLDAILVLADPEPYAAHGEWVSEFGLPALTFLEETAVGGASERRVLYETGEDVDLPLVPVAALDLLEESAHLAALLARGHRVLVDKIGLEDRLRLAAGRAAGPEAPAQRTFTELASDFWYHALWAAKKLRRGEVWIAKECIDGYMKTRLVTMLEWHAHAVDPRADTWQGGRFLERWADPGALAALERAYARYELRDVARALWETIDLWQGLEEEAARRLRLGVELDHDDLRRRVAEVVPDPRG